MRGRLSFAKNHIALDGERSVSALLTEAADPFAYLVLAHVGRPDHLSNMRVPMLFLQGSRDALAQRRFIQTVVDRLGPLATMRIVREANHSFHVPARRGRADAEILEDLIQQIAFWMRDVSSVG